MTIPFKVEWKEGSKVKSKSKRRSRTNFLEYEGILVINGKSNEEFHCYKNKDGSVYIQVGKDVTVLAANETQLVNKIVEQGLV